MNPVRHPHRHAIALLVGAIIVAGGSSSAAAASVEAGGVSAKPISAASPATPKVLFAKRSRALAISRVSVKNRRVVTTRVRVGAAGRLRLYLTKRGVTWNAYLRQRRGQLKGLTGAQRRRKVTMLRRQWKVRNAVTIPVGAARLAQPITVTLTSRAPRRLARGRYVLRARLTPDEGRRAEAHRIIRVR